MMDRPKTRPVVVEMRDRKNESARPPVSLTARAIETMQRDELLVYKVEIDTASASIRAQIQQAKIHCDDHWALRRYQLVPTCPRCHCATTAPKASASKHDSRGTQEQAH